MEKAKRVLRGAVIVIGFLLVLYALCIAVRVFIVRREVRPLATYMQTVRDLHEEMRRDVAGGESPRVTVELFKAALLQRDLTGAAQYFMATPDGSVEQWQQELERLERAGELPVLIEKIGRLQPDADGIIGTKLYAFAVRSGSGEVLMSMRLVFNGYRWKILSL
jgi:hypothetical protein